MQGSPKVRSPAQQPRAQRTVYPVPELQPVLPGPPTSTDYASFASPSNVLCIDNGATNLRAGWAAERDPRIMVENVASKYRDRKFNQPVVLAGGEVYVDATSRAHVRTPFEGDTVCNFDVMVRQRSLLLLDTAKWGAC